MRPIRRTRRTGSASKTRGSPLPSTCAPPGNRPTARELAACQPFLEEEIAAASRLRVAVALGAVAFRAFLRAWAAASQPVSVPAPRFGHGVSTELARGVRLLASYHPSQQNTFTGRLTRPMFHAVFAEARRLLEKPQESSEIQP